MAGEHLLYKWGAGDGRSLPAVVSAHDEFLVTADGEEIVDAAAGAAVVNLGHSVPGVADVARDQTDTVGYLSLSHFTHDAPERLGDELADVAPGDLNTAFLVNSGSEAIESAIKLARAYHAARGDDDRSVVIGRDHSYHGSTLGALSVSGNPSRRRPYEPMLQDWPHIPAAYPYRWAYEGSPAEQARAAARELDDAIREVGPDRVAAFVAEPVSGASIPAAHPHPAYFEEVRRICDRHGVLFVADEVMTGFGRTGETFAVERYDVQPDMMAVGKGLSAGYAPISALLVADGVAAGFRGAGATPFDHGHTFGGNPVSAAVASHVVDRYDADVVAAGAERGAQLVEELAPIADHPMVGEIRRAGAMVGVEFVADRETKAPFDPDLAVADRVYDAALEAGVYTYPGGGAVDGVRGDHLMLTPPLTVSSSSVEKIGRAVVDAVRTVAADLDV